MFTILPRLFLHIKAVFHKYNEQSMSNMNQDMDTDDTHTVSILRTQRLDHEVQFQVRLYKISLQGIHSKSIEEKRL